MPNARSGAAARVEPGSEEDASWGPRRARPGDAGRVRLRPLRPEDLPVIRRWDADRRLARLYGAAPSDLAREGARHLAAIEAGGRLVGLIGLSGISPVTRSAELRVLIGRAEDRGQGFGRAAVQAYLGRVREAFNLSHVYVRVLAGNRPALRCFESCGFRRIGVLRVRHDRRYADPPLPDDVVLLTL